VPATQDVLKAMNKGEDRKSPGHLIPDGFLARATNVRFTDGVPERIRGYQALLSSVGSRPPDGLPVVFAFQHVVGSVRWICAITESFLKMGGATGTARNQIWVYNDATGWWSRARKYGNEARVQHFWVCGFGNTKIFGGLSTTQQPHRLDANGDVDSFYTEFNTPADAGDPDYVIWVWSASGYQDSSYTTYRDSTGWVGEQDFTPGEEIAYDGAGSYTLYVSAWIQDAINGYSARQQDTALVVEPAPDIVKRVKIRR